MKDRAVLGITGQYLDSMSARFYGLTPGMYVASISNESVSNAGITQGCIITRKLMIRMSQAAIPSLRM